MGNVRSQSIGTCAFYNCIFKLNLFKLSEVSGGGLWQRLTAFLWCIPINSGQTSALLSCKWSAERWPTWVSRITRRQTLGPWPGTRHMRCSSGHLRPGGGGWDTNNSRHRSTGPRPAQSAGKAGNGNYCPGSPAQIKTGGLQETRIPTLPWNIGLTCYVMIMNHCHRSTHCLQQIFELFIASMVINQFIGQLVSRKSASRHLQLK